MWIVGLQYDGSAILYLGETTLLYHNPCETLGIYEIQGTFVTLCSRNTSLFSCDIRLDMTDVSTAFFSCGGNPLLQRRVTQISDTAISNVVRVGDNFDHARLHFFVGKDLYSFSISRNRLLGPFPVSLIRCDYVRHIAIESGESVYLYCNSSAIYRYHLTNEMGTPELLSSDGQLYYPCRGGSYHIDDNQVHYSGHGGNNITAPLPDPALAIISGQCFGPDKLVYQDRMANLYLITESHSSLNIELLFPNSGNSPPDVRLVLSRYVVVLLPGLITVIDVSEEDYPEIIHSVGTPAALVTVVTLRSTSDKYKSVTPTPDEQPVTPTPDEPVTPTPDEPVIPTSPPKLNIAATIGYSVLSLAVVIIVIVGSIGIMCIILYHRRSKSKK